ncbi:MAG: hypothetical protein KC486_05270, partial [Myxococcales bacterium]|nr:hypothetical protein [Myxococcales bacterium]
MADTNTNSQFGKSLTDVNIGQMVASIGVAIAEAQQAIDMSSLRIAEMFTGEYVDDEGKRRSSLISFDGEKLSLLELGFTPTFYQFVDTLIEVKIAIRISRENESTKKVGTKTTESTWRSRSKTRSSSFGVVVSTTTVDASYSSKYSYSAEG